MAKTIRSFWALVLTAAVLVACAGDSTLAGEELSAVVRADAVAFESAAVPPAMLDALDDYDVVIIGETHLISEQRALTASMIRGLHERGVRQLLLEWPHAADWVLNDFVVDGPLAEGWRPPTWLYGDLLTEIRDFNRSLPDGEALVVRGIDVNLDNYGGADDFRQSLSGLHSRFFDRSPVKTFLAAEYTTTAEQVAAVNAAVAELGSQRSELTSRWGEPIYAATVEMLEVEAASIEVRAQSDDERSAALREAEMKRLADLRLAESVGKAVVNVGGNHAQKERLRGTHTEWIGDYLVNASPIVAGSAVSVVVLPATIVDGDGSIGYDIRDESPPNELLRVISDVWPNQTVFLPFDDDVFSSAKVAINIEGTVQGAYLERHWDAVILLPTGTRIPLP